MNEKELMSNLNDDYRLIQSRYKDRLFKRYDKIRQKNRINKTSDFPNCFEFRTPSKNNWIYIVSKATSDEKYNGTESCASTILFYFYDKVGIRVFTITPYGAVVFNIHFFKRYNERMNLNLDLPLDKVKHYFISNSGIIENIREGLVCKDVVGKGKDGFILGNIKDGSCFTVYNTFISNDMKNVEQELIGSTGMNLFVEIIENELNKKDFDRNKYNYVADIYKSLVA